MKKEQTIWMQPDHVYVVSGGVSANSLLFEDKYCHELFFSYFRRFVSPMVEVLHYKLTATEWAMLIKTKSKRAIKKAYFKQREKSQVADRDKDFTGKDLCRQRDIEFYFNKRDHRFSTSDLRKRVYNAEDL